MLELGKRQENGINLAVFANSGLVKSPHPRYNNLKIKQRSE